MFRAEKLVAYRFCDNVWTLVMKDVEFRDVSRAVDGIVCGLASTIINLQVETLKFVACDGRALVPASTTL